MLDVAKCGLDWLAICQCIWHLAVNIVIVPQNERLDFNFLWICRIMSHKSKFVMVHVVQSCLTTGCSVGSMVCFSVLAKVEDLVSR